ncbi:SH2 domain-containing adapter protein F-like isoform X2 [Cynoglossus semilaevis]|uniref:Src homology 2 domain containing transforming protein D n=1 Tax=Cynoglossus semilaevis TaxID=244447 RepID=A0A3P8UXH9_CYNSE|nr:SH2 domain-containing adapter protein F-like isoform X2 [Cynoglossus semilaevis]
MAKWLKDYLNFGSRRDPPQPPRPDYTESEILRAYRAQKELDFEDPYQHSEKVLQNGGFSSCNTPMSLPPLTAFGSVLSNGVEVVPSAPAVSDADTDYSDPFDAHPNSRVRQNWVSKPAPADSCSYMEPFEAQRIISELQHSMMNNRSVSGDAGQLYDNPYEEKTHHHRAALSPQHQGQKVEGGFGLIDTRESKLPQDDERPADEYDQPWEWKKDNISKALAVQFEGAERERSRAHPDQTRLTKSGATPTKVDSTIRLIGDTPPLLGERVDPALPLERQVWYHGALSRTEAENLLTLCKESSYLVRKSQTSQNDYSLSLRSCKGFMHMKFTLFPDGRFVLGENSPPFFTIPEVIHYYTTHKLPIRGAEHMSLLYPVIVQTL